MFRRDAGSDEEYHRIVDADLNPSAFSTTVGDQFTMSETSEDALVLEHLAERAPSPGAPRVQPFTLTFVGTADTVVPQGTYTLRHATLGLLSIFLVPVGPGSDGRHRYDAVFN